MKNYNGDQVLEKFNSLTKDEKINVLDSAIDYMQSYNGRSKLTCIALAMGFENTEGGWTTFTLKSK